MNKLSNCKSNKVWLTRFFVRLPRKKETVLMSTKPSTNMSDGLVDIRKSLFLTVVQLPISFCQKIRCSYFQFPKDLKEPFSYCCPIMNTTAVFKLESSSGVLIGRNLIGKHNAAPGARTSM
jgi:hypothetical protein